MASNVPCIGFVVSGSNYLSGYVLQGVSLSSVVQFFSNPTIRLFNAMTSAYAAQVIESPTPMDALQSYGNGTA